MIRRRRLPHPNAAWRRKLAQARREGIEASAAQYANFPGKRNPYEGKFDAANYALNLAWLNGATDQAYAEKRRRLPFGHPERVRSPLDWAEFKRIHSTPGADTVKRFYTAQEHVDLIGAEILRIRAHDQKHHRNPELRRELLDKLRTARESWVEPMRGAS